MPPYRNYRARGRTRKNADGMNQTEQAYSELLEQRRLAGEIAWWKFESIKLRLADGCWYSPDYCVLLPDGLVEFHEVKAAKADGKPLYEDDARVKIKVAAEQHWQFRFVGAYKLPRKAGGGWVYETFNEGA